MRRALWFGAFAICAISAACFNLDGFSTGAPDGGSPDGAASTPTPEGGGPIAEAGSAETGASDGGTWAPDAAACDARAPSSDGLLAYYPFDETSGNLANDCSGNDHTGIFVSQGDGGSRMTGKIGGALSVSQTASTGCVELGTPAALDTVPFTLTAWVIVDSFPDTQNTGYVGYIFGQAVDATLGGFRVGAESYGTSAVTFVNGESDASSSDVGPPWPTDKAWHHLAVTVDADNAAFYLDGALLVVPTPHLPITFAGTTSMRIGCRSDNQNYLDGAIDELRLYGRVLSSAEISELARP